LGGSYGTSKEEAFLFMACYKKIEGEFEGENKGCRDAIYEEL